MFSTENSENLIVKQVSSNCRVVIHSTHQNSTTTQCQLSMKLSGIDGPTFQPTGPLHSSHSPKSFDIRKFGVVFICKVGIIVASVMKQKAKQRLFCGNFSNFLSYGAIVSWADDGMWSVASSQFHLLPFPKEKKVDPEPSLSPKKEAGTRSS